MVDNAKKGWEMPELFCAFESSKNLINVLSSCLQAESKDLKVHHVEDGEHREFKDLEMGDEFESSN